MNIDVFKKIFDNSENKNIDIFCDGKIVAQFVKVPTAVTNEGYGTFSVTDKISGNVRYFDTNHISNIWVQTYNNKNEDNNFID